MMDNFEQKVRTPLSPSEIVFHEQASFRNSILSLCSNTVGIGLLLYSLTTGFNDPRKVFYLVGAGVLGWVGLSSSNLGQSSRRKALDYSDIADQRLQDYLYHGMDSSQGVEGFVTPAPTYQASVPISAPSQIFPQPLQIDPQRALLSSLEQMAQQRGLTRVDPQTQQVTKAIPKPQAPKPQAENGFDLRWFGWDEIKTQRNKHAHFILAGGTGDGKTTLAQWLAYQYPQDGERVIAVVPHYKNGDFGSADLILGAGRKYGFDAREYRPEVLDDKGKVVEKEQGEYPIAFKDILAGIGGVPSCCQFVRSLYQEMSDRYNSPEYLTGQALEPMTVFLDEYPAWSKLPGVAECVGKLIREARKVGIRLCILTQGLEVKTLGIEGEGSLRDSASVIRLGEFAINHIKYLSRISGIGKDELDALNLLLNQFQGSGQRPCMVNDRPAKVPNLTDFSAFLASIAPEFTSGIELTKSSPNIEDVFTALETPQESQFSESNIEPQKSISPRDNVLLEYLKSRGGKTVKKIVNAKSRSDRGGYKTDEVREILDRLVHSGVVAYDESTSTYTAL
jgi:hypothetical protein